MPWLHATYIGMYNGTAMLSVPNLAVFGLQGAQSSKGEQKVGPFKMDLLPDLATVTACC